MKIAAIVYGMYCNLEFVFPTWKYMYDLNCDIYLSTWKKSYRDSVSLKKISEHDVTEEMITNYIKPKNFVLIDEKSYSFKNEVNKIERCIVHWDKCMEMINNSGIKYDYIMLHRIDSYTHPIDSNIFYNFNKTDRIYGINEIQENEDGSLNIDPAFFFGTFENIKNLITDFPHHSVNSHDMTAKKIKSLGLFVEPIPNLFIAPVRPNLIEITDKEKMSYWDITSKFLEW
jgi:hypothetical protein